MANYTVPAHHGGQIPIHTQDRDQLSTLDVVWANKYENEIIIPTNAEKMEFEFYKGAPPQWLNFYWAEHKNSPFVRRDLYDELQEKIQKTRKQRRSIAKINLLHDPGSGGSTLAMQLLWDQRKKLRCAKLLDSTMDTRVIAKQVLLLFRAGGLEKQNTVLLLLDGNYTNEEDLFQVKLEEKLCDEIKANNITAAIPVVIILNCLHHTDLTEGAQYVKLSSKLSEAEKERYTTKQSSIIQNYGDRHTELYAFNIMQRNYDSSYVTEVCRNLQPFQKKNRPRTQQLLAFLALVNSYVPGSDLPQDLCQMFLRRERNNLIISLLRNRCSSTQTFWSCSQQKKEMTTLRPCMYEWYIL
ncbi:sterile alpha motif domain-containing protein 9 [Silurus meridionalis]|uniref:sterile alpha motif domain-containing protein 9 n=1 Tax=Silurus meridionalis TaxID=175797 RepID=UPI001EEBF86D|nr:sterile alpha motif domain-containing protein 9 [Silurus meridionalis]